MMLLLALLAAQDWVPEGDGFLDRATGDRKGAPELVAHGLELRERGDFEGALAAFTALRRARRPEHRRRAHFETAVTLDRAGRYWEAYHEFEAYIVRYPQSDRATEAKRGQMSAAMELTKVGATKALVFTSHQTGIDLLRESLRRYPREDFTSEFVQRLGMYYYEEGEFDLAEIEFLTVLDQYSGSPDAVLALYMLGRSSERRFEGIDYDHAPLQDARRHYERFLEEQERMRALPDPARSWVDATLPSVRERLTSVYDRMQAKQLMIAEYYDWKGYPKSAAIYFRAILADEASFTRILPKYGSEAAAAAREWLTP